MQLTQNTQFAFDPSRVDELIKQQLKYYDNYVKVKEDNIPDKDPSMFTQSPEELLALAQASDDPMSFLEEIAIPEDELRANQIDNIEDQGILDDIMSMLSQDPDFDGNLSTVQGMVNELLNQIQTGELSPESAQEQLVFNILELFNDEGGA
ncbi:hypothetical protein CGI18_07230 [Vibrio parahaemolyticus]|uniref:hypothetical protein n=1 Tax=Vibrio parahaemolyticus TaxID=670 RepID=UPI00112072D4|nr:hypothetical protein [Vibrio parahaemolyticus]TOK48277.1 hypothetical protein CGI18_07230 [Vibrio parahaemolyticus]